MEERSGTMFLNQCGKPVGFKAKLVLKSGYEREGMGGEGRHIWILNLQEVML